jgi:hypothetical protein
VNGELRAEVEKLCERMVLWRHAGRVYTLASSLLASNPEMITVGQALRLSVWIIETLDSIRGRDETD